MKRRTKLLKQLSAFIVFLFLAQLTMQFPARANGTIFESFSPLSSTNPEYLRNDHHLRSLSVYVYEADPDLITIKLAFAGAVGPTTFSSSNLLLRLKILPVLTDYVGNSGHLWLDAPKIAYQGTKKIPVAASAYLSPNGVAGSPRKDVSSCGATSWLDDVPDQNLVSFQLSRNCFDLTNTLYVIAYIEEDIYNNAQTRDSKYVPVYPMFLDMTKIPRPAKVIPKKDQSIAAFTSRPEYTMDNTTIQVNAFSSAGSPLTFTSRTPTTCAVSSTGLIQTLASGNCQVAVDAAATLTLNAAPTALVSINLVKKAQALYFNPPGIVYLNQEFINLEISSEFGLPVTVVSTSPLICTFPYPTTNPTTVQMIRSGTCSFKVNQPGNNIYNSNEVFANFYIEPTPVIRPTPTVRPTPTPTRPAPTPSPTRPSPTPSPSRSIGVDIGTQGGGSGGSAGDGGVAGGTKIKITCVKKGQKNIVVVSPKKCPSGYTKK